MPAGKYTRTPEMREAFRQLMASRGAWNKGKKTGIVPTCGFKSGGTPWNKGTKGLQVAWNKGIHQHQTVGEKNAAWKGGITPLVQKIRHSFLYRQWRSDVFKRDNYTCQECGIRGGWLEAHHIKTFSTIIEEYGIKTTQEAFANAELWDINNGLTLCQSCHNETKRKPNGND